MVFDRASWVVAEVVMNEEEGVAGGRGKLLTKKLPIKKSLPAIKPRREKRGKKGPNPEIVSKEGTMEHGEKHSTILRLPGGT